MSSHKRNIFILIFIGLLLEIGLIVTVLDYNKTDHSKDVRTEHCGLFFGCGSPYPSRYCDPGPCLPSGYPPVAQQEFRNNRMFVLSSQSYRFGSEKIYSDGIMGHWLFNKLDNSTRVEDFSNFHNDGMIVGPTWPQRSPEQGDTTGLMLDFKNDGDRVEVPNSSSLNFYTNDDLVIFAWIRPHKLKEFNEVVTKGRTDGSNFTNYALRVGNGAGKENKLVFYYLDVSGAWHTYQSIDDVVPLDKWSQIAVTYKLGKGKSIQLYINGEKIKGTWTAGNGNTGSMPTPSPLWIGSIYDSNTSHWTFDGLIADVNIYKGIVNSNELKDLVSFVELPDGHYINE